MFVARLLVNAVGERKLAARGIAVEEVLQVLAEGPFVTANPRVPGSRLMIGPPPVAGC